MEVVIAFREMELSYLNIDGEGAQVVVWDNGRFVVIYPELEGKGRRME